MAKREGPQLPEPWGHLTLQSLMTAAAAETPTRVFLRDCPDREAWNGMEPRTLTHDAFLKGASFLAAQLKTLGVEPGDGVLLLLPNTAELPLAILACHLAGATPAVAPVDERVDMLRAAAERCEATTILTTGRVGDIAVGEKARLVAAKVLAVRCVAGFGFDLPDGIVSLEGWSEEDVLPLPATQRRQSDIGLITFTRDQDSLCAVARSEGQMIAEALAISSVMPLDEQHGLISLMQPGAAASIATSLTLPLYAGASIRLIGPYDTSVLVRALEAEPAAFLYCPDHFAAQLAPDSLGPERLKAHAGILALARIDRPKAELVPSGPMASSLLVDFCERGMMTVLSWPSDGQLDLPASYPHPIQTVLPEGERMLQRVENTNGRPDYSGFGAAMLIRREDAEVAGKAA